MHDTGRQRGSISGPNGGSRRHHAHARRVLGWGEDPLLWAIPAGRWLGLRIGFHVIVALWASIELIAAIPANDPALFTHRVAAVSSFISLSLLREIARARWAARLGRQPDHIIVWPLGGLGRIGGPAYETSVLAETGGLLFGVFAWCLLGAGLAASGADLNLLLINPFDPGTPAHTIGVGWKLALWWAYYANGVILCINLLPMRPFDGGRIIHSLIRAWRYPTEASTITARISALTAISLFLAAAAMSQTRLLAVAALAALATWLEFRREVFVHEIVKEYQSPPLPSDHGDDEQSRSADDRDEFSDPNALADPIEHPPSGLAAQEPTEHDLEIDDILLKISRQGLASLDERERDALKRATEARRKRRQDRA